MMTSKKELTLEELAILQSEMLKKSKNKEAAWGLWAGLSFFGGHRFYTEDYGLAGAMLSTTVFPLIIFVFVLFGSLPVALFYPSLFFVIGSVVWSWIDAFFLNRRLDTLNNKIENDILNSIKKS
ncbi:NINE protein [Bacillaceae bacterium IKA-2]|nr:NINE protein [Bacillaceae bacterium IKA-2]